MTVRLLLEKCDTIKVNVYLEQDNDLELKSSEYNNGIINSKLSESNNVLAIFCTPLKHHDQQQCEGLFAAVLNKRD